MQTLATQSQEELLALLGQQQAIITEQADTLGKAQAEILRLRQEIADLKAGRGKGKPASSVPDFVRPNPPPTAGPPKPRKPRAQSFRFHRQPPSAEVEHACACCPDCGRGLSGGWEYSRRQVVEIPVVPAQVSDPIVVARRCGVCGTLCTPKVDWQALTGGSGH